MEGQAISGDEVSVNLVREEDEEEFRSCCEDEDEVWKETEEQVKGETKDESKYDLDEFSVKMFFKGMSIAGYGDPGCGLSGIGVVMERSTNVPAIQVQKRLDFYVEGLVADYLALMDGLVEAVQNKVRRVYAFTDSELLYDQVSHEEKLEVPILVALRQRILEHASNLEAFVLKLAPDVDLERPSKLAQVAIGVVSFPAKGVESLENCSICCDDKPSLMMITMKCSHKFCSHCMRTYVDGKVQSSQVPIRCPQLRCKYYISTAECKSFLPLTSYESLEKSFAEANILHSDRMYCPFPNCSVLLDPLECFSARASSSSQSDNSCIECPVCQRFICADCGVPWHTSMSCEEFQNLPLEERDAADITLHRLAQSNSWRRCQQCRRMIELSQGCYHMTCWCGHEFCYSCGAEYRDSQQTCQCAFWDEDNNNTQDLVTQSMQESEQWAWETFNSLPMIMDAYSDQEKSQLALIQRFLAGGFSLSDHPPYQSPPRCTDSYVDAMKDLHQLPWLERCGHEFCYSCGAEYRDSQQTCQCAFWDEDNNNTQDLVTQSMQESEQWAWETFNSLPMIMDAYSDQEKSQLALIQRFLAGGFSLSDHPPYQSPPRCTDSYVDAMKDIHQLPWLERFVSVISDNYYEEYIQ